RDLGSAARGLGPVARAHAFDDRLDREPRGDLSGRVAAHAVRDREDPVRAPGIQEQLVLVRLAPPSDVRETRGGSLHRVLLGAERRVSAARPVRSSSSFAEAAVWFGSCSSTASSWLSASLNSPARSCAN